MYQQKCDVGRLDGPPKFNEVYL